MRGSGEGKGRTNHQPVGEPSANLSWEVSTKRTLGAIVVVVVELRLRIEWFITVCEGSIAIEVR